MINHAARRSGVQGILLGFALYTLVRTGEALAGDAPSMDGIPQAFAAPADAGKQMAWSTDFRPRRHGIGDGNPSVTSLDEGPAIRGASLVQRAFQHESPDRVPLLTLWESKNSTVSLMASRAGNPSLQWISTLSNHGRSKRGLLDRWLPVSLAGVGSGLRAASRPSGPAPKQPGAPAAAGLK